MNGFYVMYFTGRRGSGHAVFAMKDGVISGADAVGGVLDGTYTDEGGDVDVSVKLKVPPGTLLVTGDLVGRDSLVQEINTKLPSNFCEGRPIGVKTPTGPINVIFRRLRDVP